MIIGIHCARQRSRREPDQGQEAHQRARRRARTKRCVLVPPIELTLEYAVEFIADDELVEVTPKIDPHPQALPEGARAQARLARSRLRRPALALRAPVNDPGAEPEAPSRDSLIRRSAVRRPTSTPRLKPPCGGSSIASTISWTRRRSTTSCESSIPALSGSREKLFMFLSGWLGGPQLYVEKHGHPMLRARHLPFPSATPSATAGWPA